jgi:uncharacterized membrane protein
MERDVRPVRGLRMSLISCIPPVYGRGMTDSVRRHPAIAAHEVKRAEDIQLRIADAITAFAGSMAFVYLHILGFGLWMWVAERNPWPMLTLIVSLEAIFLSTFVMIGQNRQAAFQQAKADHDFVEQELELKTNTELTREIARLVREVKDLVERSEH